MNEKSEIRIAQVPNQLENLSRELDELENAISILGDQLQPALREEVEVNANSPSKDEESLVSLANTIRSHVLKVSGMVVTVNSLRAKLEI